MLDNHLEMMKVYKIIQGYLKKRAQMSIFIRGHCVNNTEKKNPNKKY